METESFSLLTWSITSRGEVSDLMLWNMSAADLMNTWSIAPRSMFQMLSVMTSRSNSLAQPHTVAVSLG